MDTPYASQDVPEVAGLLKSLEQSAKKAGAGKHATRAKKNTYDVS